MRYTFCLILSIIFLSCKSGNNEPVTIFCSNPSPNIKVAKVSLKEEEEIKKLNGKYIQVEGMMYMDFEDVAIYPFNNSGSKGLWLGSMITDSVGKKKAYSIRSRKVLMTGKVNLAFKGHLSAYLGTLDSIICLKAL